MKKSFCIIALLAFCFICQSVFPSSAESFYFSFKIGGYFPQSSEVPMKDADPGLGLEVAGGHFLSKNIALELGIGGYQTEVPVYNSFGSKIDTTFSVMPITMVLKAGPRFGNFFPYIEAGGGYYFTEIQDTFDNETAGKFGPLFGFGANYGAFGIEARYISATVDLLNSEVDIDGFLLTLNLSLGNTGN